MSASALLGGFLLYTSPALSLPPGRLASRVVALPAVFSLQWLVWNFEDALCGGKFWECREERENRLCRTIHDEKVRIEGGIVQEYNEIV